jgi:hypothetical protein
MAALQEGKECQFTDTLDFPGLGKHTANIGPTIDTTGICFADDA